MAKRKMQSIWCGKCQRYEQLFVYCTIDADGEVINLDCDCSHHAAVKTKRATAVKKRKHVTESDDGAPRKVTRAERNRLRGMYPWKWMPSPCPLFFDEVTK